MKTFRCDACDKVAPKQGPDDAGLIPPGWFRGNTQIASAADDADGAPPFDCAPNRGTTEFDACSGTCFLSILTKIATDSITYRAQVIAGRKAKRT